VAAFRTRDAAPGERYNYVSADTQVLGLVLRASNRHDDGRVPDRKDLAAMGAEAEAAWVIDRGGYETAFSSFSATLRDWGTARVLLAKRRRAERPADRARGVAARADARARRATGAPAASILTMDTATRLDHPGGAGSSRSAASAARPCTSIRKASSSWSTLPRASTMDPNFRDQISLWHSVVDQLAAHPI
jgi:hypothetical protein